MIYLKVLKYILIISTLLFSCNKIYGQDNIYKTQLKSQHTHEDSLKVYNSLEIFSKSSNDIDYKNISDNIEHLYFEVIIARKGHDLILIKNKGNNFDESVKYQLASLNKGDLVIFKDIQFIYNNKLIKDINDITFYIK